jgi:hypothetical protein
MTQDGILQTLREVIAEAENFTTWTVSTPHLVELVKRAVEAEREECAKEADQYMRDCEGKSFGVGDAIRARGVKHG